MTQGDALQAVSVAYFVTIAVIALWETFWPRRSTIVAALVPRWLGNVGLFIIAVTAVRLVFPMLCITAAHLAAARGWGVFGAIDVPPWLAFALTFLAVDLGRYLNHRLFHVVPLFWRVHAVHHSDTDVDVSTGLRFHPLEALATVGTTLGIVFALGGPVEAVVLSELVSAIVSPWSHGKIHVPASIDRLLRPLLVTPDLHRIHHSIDRREADSNYGNTLIVWDRLFGTYVAAPAVGQEHMIAGLADFPPPQCLRLTSMLTHPFLRGTSRREEPHEARIPS